MSRSSVALGSILGAGAGVVAGAFGGAAYIDGRLWGDEAEDAQRNIALLGALAGSFFGAVIGAGSCEPPKTVGTSGPPRHLSNGAFP